MYGITHLFEQTQEKTTKHREQGGYHVLLERWIMNLKPRYQLTHNCPLTHQQLDPIAVNDLKHFQED